MRIIAKAIIGTLTQSNCLLYNENMKINYLEISRIITLIASVFITIGLYHQAIRMFKIKSAKDFTWTIIFALFFNELAWLNYGYALTEWPIIFVGAVNIPAIIIIVIGYYKYRNE